MISSKQKLEHARNTSRVLLLKALEVVPGAFTVGMIEAHMKAGRVEEAKELIAQYTAS